MLTVLAPAAAALDCAGIALDGGCLFTITGGDTEDPDDGFAVTNADDVPLWDFVQARDLQAIGYPISQRWIDGPFTLQAFQKVILQWHPGKQRMNYYNTLDALANRYPDVELPNVPPHQVLAEDQGATFGAIIRNHLALLDQNPAIKERFLSEPDWLNLYGLPIRYEEREVDGHPQGLQILRAQRTVFVIWNVPAPGTTVGRVNLQNVPDKVKQLSDVIIPDRVKQPLYAPPPDVLPAIAELPWARDGLTLVERHAVDRLVRMARDFPDLFAYLLYEIDLRRLRHPNAPDIAPISLPRPLTAATLDGLHRAVEIASLPWVQDGLTDFEHLAARILYDFAFIFPATVEVLLKRPWLHDGISPDERHVLDGLNSRFYSSAVNPGPRAAIDRLGADLMAMPLMDSIEGFEAQAIFTLFRFSVDYFDNARELALLQRNVAYLLSKGGLTDEHALILKIHGNAILDGMTDQNDPRLLDQFLVDPASRGITIERRRISLPLTGSALLIVLRSVPVSPQTMDVFEQAVRAVEHVMGIRFPTNTIGVIISRYTFNTGGVPFVSVFAESFRVSDTSNYLRSLFAHELAHQFFAGDAPTWVTEGAARFVQVRAGFHERPDLDEWRSHCPVAGLADISESFSTCNYNLGALMYLDLYDALGHHEFHRGFSKLYRILNFWQIQYHANRWGDKTRLVDRCDFCQRKVGGLYLMRRAFVEGADSAAADIANHIITRWYYGPLQ
ncbi:MAG: hypothetical protein OXG33_13060 [Chloroflexi bacterium]|nr:hypothetical protein [Chloroflexota bacterium]